jgi:PAS domain S-box-containing protein
MVEVLAGESDFRWVVRAWSGFEPGCGGTHARRYRLPSDRDPIYLQSMSSEFGAVRSDEWFLRGVVDKVSAMLAYWDSEQRCRFANHAYEQWFGVSPESLLGKHISELLGPIYELNRPHIEAALRGEPQEFEREIPDPAGGPSRHSLANYLPDVADGAVRGFFVLVVDISAIKRSKLLLAESEAKFSGIISIAADAIVSVDADQRIRIFNKGAEAIFGYTRDEVLGRDFGILLPPRVRDVHHQHAAAFMAGSDVSRQMKEWNMAILGVRKNGEEFPAEAAISKLTVGTMTLATVALRDISERKRVEMEQLVLTEAGAVFSSSLDYRRTLESISKLVVRHIAEMCIVDMTEGDDSIVRLTVAHADAAKAALCERLMRPSFQRRHTLAASALETRQPQLFDDISADFMESKAQDQEHLQVLRELAARSGLTVPLLSGDRVLGALTLLSTRPRRFGPGDIGLVIELARRAALAIENARLYEAEKRATRARDEVLGIVAHDVRSPLHVIQLAAQMLERKLSKQEDSNCREYVKTIMQSVDRAEHLIRDLLDISRMEAGALVLVRDAVSTRSVVVDVLASLRLLAAEASIDMKLELDEQLPEIWADQVRLIQVLENLIGNAIKFTPAGGCILVTVTSDPGKLVRFSVADTGVGISEQDLPHVFDRFWQAEAGSHRGAGLGLPICKGIIEAHGGRIWAERRKSCGTRLSFTIQTVAAARA